MGLMVPLPAERAEADRGAREQGGGSAETAVRARECVGASVGVISEIEWGRHTWPHMGIHGGRPRGGHH